MFERFTVDARRVVVYAQVECRLLGHPHIGTEQFLLGLLHDQTPTGEVLLSVGVTLTAARERVAVSQGGATRSPAGISLSPPGLSGRWSSRSTKPNVWARNVSLHRTYCVRCLRIRTAARSTSCAGSASTSTIWRLAPASLPRPASPTATRIRRLASGLSSVAKWHVGCTTFPLRGQTESGRPFAGRR